MCVQRGAVMRRATEGVARSGGVGARMHFIQELMGKLERGEVPRTRPDAEASEQQSPSEQEAAATTQGIPDEAQKQMQKERMHDILRELYGKDAADMSPEEQEEFARRSEQLCDELALGDDSASAPELEERFAAIMADLETRAAPDQ